MPTKGLIESISKVQESGRCLKRKKGDSHPGDEERKHKVPRICTTQQACDTRVEEGRSPKRKRPKKDRNKDEPRHKKAKLQKQKLVDASKNCGQDDNEDVLRSKTAVGSYLNRIKFPSQGPRLYFPPESVKRRAEEERINKILREVEYERCAVPTIQKKVLVIEDLSQLSVPKNVQQVAVGEKGQLLSVPDFIREEIVEEVLSTDKQEIKNNSHNNLDKLCNKILNYRENNFLKKTLNRNVNGSSAKRSKYARDLRTATLIKNAEYLLSLYKNVEKYGITGNFNEYKKTDSHSNKHVEKEIFDNNNDKNFKITTEESSTITKNESDNQSLNLGTKSTIPKSSSKNKEESNESIKNHSNVVAQHYNKLKGENIQERNQSSIVNMRDFNNWVKNRLINRYVSIIRRKKFHTKKKSLTNRSRRKHRREDDEIVRVLDICCGKGGDMLKWRKAHITYLVCVDIAEKSVVECKRRYNNLGSARRSPPFQAEFIVHDCTEVGLNNKFKHPKIEFDLVNCQFALHYSFESQSQAENMLENVSKNLRHGGFFIGTVPNEKELRSRSLLHEGAKFGNEIYEVEFLFDKNNPPTYGAKYNFLLKGAINCPEFLIKSSALRELALKYNLELITFESLGDFYEKSRKRGEHPICNKNVLYPPHVQATPIYFSHRRSRRNGQDSTNCFKSKIISQSEWDVITLYSVFVFQKR